MVVDLSGGCITVWGLWVCLVIAVLFGGCKTVWQTDTAPHRWVLHCLVVECMFGGCSAVCLVVLVMFVRCRAVWWLYTCLVIVVLFVGLCLSSGCRYVW